MSILHSPDSAESKERVKWEAQYSQFGPGQRPYVKRDYPMRLYLAGPPDNGLGAITIIEECEVADAHAAEWPHSRGFRSTPLEAIAAYDDQQLEFAKLAANLEYQKKNQLSEKAAAEVSAAQDKVSGHLPSVPVTPIKKSS